MCSPGWKGRGKLAGAGWTRTMSKQTLGVKDQMTLLSAKEGTRREIKWQPRMKGQVETDL